MSKKIDMSLIKKLRERTDAPVMDCKSALEEASGDLTTSFGSIEKKRHY